MKKLKWYLIIYGIQKCILFTFTFFLIPSHGFSLLSLQIVLKASNYLFFLCWLKTIPCFTIFLNCSALWICIIYRMIISWVRIWFFTFSGFLSLVSWATNCLLHWNLNKLSCFLDLMSCELVLENNLYDF